MSLRTKKKRMADMMPERRGERNHEATVREQRTIHFKETNTPPVS